MSAQPFSGPRALTNATLHHAIARDLVERVRAPSVRELASRFRRSEADVRSALRALAAEHGVVLHPDTDNIWVMHPFSAAPAACVVSAGTRTWWAPCPWCAFGVIQLVGGTGSVTTRVGALGESVTLHLVDHELRDRDFVVHFPVPMQRAWHNVIYTCSVILLFRRPSDVDTWCSVRGIEKGDVRPAEQVSRFATAWYGRHLSENWRKWSNREAAALFRDHGLTGPVWALPEESGTF
jgi:Alkylmercury lyase